MSPFDLSVVDRWSDERTVEVTAAGVEAYAAVVGGPSPVYAVAPAMDLVFAVAEAAVPAELRARVVHGQEDLVFHRPLPVGEKVTLRAAVVGLHGKGSGTTATIKVETRDAAGQLVNEQYVTEFYRGVPTDLAAGSAAPPLPREPLDGPPLHTATTPLPPDLPRQYADASGDHNPIHLDDDFARAAGLPGVIVHGLASLAIATGVVLSASGKTGLRRLGCRFTRPVAPGDTLTTRVWAHEGGYRFDAVDGHDQVVLGSGVAILTP
ncbi:MaoC/PaaZ C-terminal domain-containing protein [Phytohabitans rumicis]|uniref:MaoC/PaaZ C-terminal domain-containing protein n=1 Tax=Phytohabitans rumicis TaxID=1076125 RepID=UPI0031F0B526